MECFDQTRVSKQLPGGLNLFMDQTSPSVTAVVQNIQSVVKFTLNHHGKQIKKINHGLYDNEANTRTR